MAAVGLTRHTTHHFLNRPPRLNSMVERIPRSVSSSRYGRRAVGRERERESADMFYCKPHTITVLLLLLFSGLYVALFTGDNDSFVVNSKWGLLAAALVFVLIGMVQFPNGNVPRSPVITCAKEREKTVQGPLCARTRLSGVACSPSRSFTKCFWCTCSSRTWTMRVSCSSTSTPRSACPFPKSRTRRTAALISRRSGRAWTCLWSHMRSDGGPRRSSCATFG